MNDSTNSKIKSIDNLSKHKIQSGQVVFDLQGWFMVICSITQIFIIYDFRCS